MRAAREAVEARRRRDVDDGPAAVFRHFTGSCLRAQKRTDDIHVEPRHAKDLGHHLADRMVRPALGGRSSNPNGKDPVVRALDGVLPAARAHVHTEVDPCLAHRPTMPGYSPDTRDGANMADKEHR